MDTKSHWEQVYQSRAGNALSWYQPHALLSLELIRGHARGPDARVFDVGGGSSPLADDLLAAGFTRIAVLDISGSALAAARQRLGERAAAVRWIEGDITAADLEPGSVDVWHDRAVFHFLTDARHREAYVRQLLRAVPPGGTVIIATFAPDGPERCSGLPVVRYAPDQLLAQLGPAFDLVEHRREGHRTPAGATQQFVYCVFLRR